VELPDGSVLLVDATEGWLLDPATGQVERSGRLALPRGSQAVTGGARAEWLRVVRLAGGEIVFHGALPYGFEPVAFERYTP
jgi:hypothetical protein